MSGNEHCILQLGRKKHEELTREHLHIQQLLGGAEENNEHLDTAAMR
jgi:hypothetical protein